MYHISKNHIYTGCAIFNVGMANLNNFGICQSINLRLYVLQTSIYYNFPYLSPFTKTMPRNTEDAHKI